MIFKITLALKTDTLLPYYTTLHSGYVQNPFQESMDEDIFSALF